MGNILDMTTSIVTAHTASRPDLTTEDILAEIQSIYDKLEKLQAGASPAKMLEFRQVDPMTSFGETEVRCLVCGRGGLQSLSAHLTRAHDMSQEQYREQFGIAKNVPLTSRSFSKIRSHSAKETHSESIGKARQARISKRAVRG